MTFARRGSHHTHLCLAGHIAGIAPRLQPNGGKLGQRGSRIQTHALVMGKMLQHCLVEQLMAGGAVCVCVCACV